MLNFTLFTNQPEWLERFSQSAKMYGIAFVILGLLGMFFPGIMSLTTAIFFGWLMLFGGVMIGVQTWQLNRKDWGGWLKALLLTVTGAMVILNPFPGVVALAILFTAYFFIDSAANLALALRLRPEPYWWIALLNGLLSFALGVYFFMAIGNPIQTLWLVGLLVGISLFFDGVMLLSLASAAKPDTK